MSLVYVISRNIFNVKRVFTDLLYVPKLLYLPAFEPVAVKILTRSKGSTERNIIFFLYGNKKGGQTDLLAFLLISPSNVLQL